MTDTKPSCNTPSGMTKQSAARWRLTEHVQTLHPRDIKAVLVVYPRQGINGVRAFRPELETKDISAIVEYYGLSYDNQRKDDDRTVLWLGVDEWP